MNKRAKNKVNAIAHWVPKDRVEVNDAIAELGKHQRERSRIETAMNDEIANIKKTHDDRAKPLGERIAELIRGLHLWCEVNRAALTNDGKVKFHEFATGQVKWRLTPWSVSLSKVAEVMALLKKEHPGKYLRIKEDIDKEALLSDRTSINDSLKGVKFSQKEEFSIVPHESKIEEVQK